MPPLHPRIIHMDRNNEFDGDDYSTMSAKIEKIEANLREEISITAADKYAPYELGQVESESTAGIMVPFGVNSIQPAAPANTTATLADLEKLHSQMDVAHNKQYTALKMEMDQVATNTTAQIRKVTDMAEQTSTQLQGFQSSIADLIKLSAENASQQRESNSQMKSVQEDLQKLTNASAGRDILPKADGGIRSPFLANASIAGSKVTKRRTVTRRHGGGWSTPSPVVIRRPKTSSQAQRHT